MIAQNASFTGWPERIGMNLESAEIELECKARDARREASPPCKPLLFFEALQLYRPPFSHAHGYIFDADSNVMADCAADEAVLRVRGWGRIGAEENAEALQDQVAEHIVTALTEFWEKHQEK